MQTVANQDNLRHVKPVHDSNVTQLNAGNDPVDFSDEQLMISYGRGDVAAFETLYHRNKGALYRYFLRQTSQSAIAEEMSHDVWLRIIKSRERYLPEARFTTYLYQIAHNCLVDFYRKQANQPVMNGSEQHLDTVPAGDDCDPEIQTDNRQARTALLQLLAQLPAEQREVFILKEEAQLSIEDIANVINENPETVKSRLRYATRKLKGGLQEWLNR
ncbi:MAG: sigma-70 family RNA polymerase sigma factor [Gammaproteobacteria bacterium]|jgi:RNA polymerase sigma-70 factor (ECF subfamily)